MIELGELEAAHAEFDNKNTRVVVASLEDQETATKTKKAFPHLIVVADAEQKLARALKVKDEHSAPDGSDMASPTTLLVDGKGIVRWIFRPDRFMTRLSPAEVLAAVDTHLAAK